MAKAKKPSSRPAPDGPGHGRSGRAGPVRPGPAARRSSRGKLAPATGKKAAAPSRAAAPQAAPVLRPVPLYEFSAGGLAGSVRLSDPGRGLCFSAGTEEKRLPAACEEVLALRHYFSRGEGGLLAPREETACEGKVDKQAVVFSHGQSPKWPVAASARYELLAQGGADATFTFRFSKPLRGFEAGVETLMPRSQPAIYLHSGGSWVRPTVGPQAQRFYPRNLGAAELIADGRWDALRSAGIALSVETRGYDYPMLVVRDERSGWAFCLLALTEECTSVWVSGAHRAVGLALVGSDVKAQSTVTCRVRVVLCQAEKLDDTLGHYRTFVQEARAGRK